MEKFAAQVRTSFATGRTPGDVNLDVEAGLNPPYLDAGFHRHDAKHG
jgi:hypothetical protein